jgi:hypothetical protein
MADSELLALSLQVAVPLWIDRIRDVPWETRIERARELAQYIASHGDNILYRGHKKGQSAEAFNALAEGLAIGAYLPGGVSAFGCHWCVDHDTCLEAEAAANDNH